MNKENIESSLDFTVGKLSISFCTNKVIKVYSYHDYLIQHPSKLIEEFGCTNTKYSYEYKKFDLHKYSSSFGFLYCIELTPSQTGIKKTTKGKYYWTQLNAKKTLTEFKANLEYKVVLDGYSLGFDFIPSSLFNDELMLVTCFYKERTKTIEWICNNSDHSYLLTLANWVKQLKEVTNV